MVFRFGVNNWGSIFLVVTIISSLAYFYNFYQVVKEVDQKQLI
ncbi:membrane protein [Streptococcus pneumoniae]|nr:membrane protein [Streptococcus pneumoniae]CWA00807.1 membrane protein [Streptococcus pneumoniae]